MMFGDPFAQRPGVGSQEGSSPGDLLRAEERAEVASKNKDPFSHAVRAGDSTQKRHTIQRHTVKKRGRNYRYYRVVRKDTCAQVIQVSKLAYPRPRALARRLMEFADAGCSKGFL